MSHLGSCMTALPIIDKIYSMKKPGDVFILSSGHAGLALYVVLEKYEGRDAEFLVEKHGLHPGFDPENGIYCSSGSLGTAVTVGVGHAYANPEKDVYVLVSDGECAEGSVWEALAFAHRMHLTNFKVHVNINGYSAYDEVDSWYLFWRIKSFYPRAHVWFTKNPRTTFMDGLNAHYVRMSEENKEELLGMTNADAFCVTPLRFYEQGFSDLLAYCRFGVWCVRQYTQRLSRSFYQRWVV